MSSADRNRARETSGRWRSFAKLPKLLSSPYHQRSVKRESSADRDRAKCRVTGRRSPPLFLHGDRRFVHDLMSLLTRDLWSANDWMTTAITTADFSSHHLCHEPTGGAVEDIRQLQFRRIWLGAKKEFYPQKKSNVTF